MHPAVLGELACGTIPNRQEFLALWLALPRLANVSFEEAMALLENRMLWGRGLGWTDIQLLASALVSRTMLWTRDRLLRHTADQLLIPVKLDEWWKPRRDPWIQMATRLARIRGQERMWQRQIEWVEGLRRVRNIASRQRWPVSEPPRVGVLLFRHLMGPDVRRRRCCRRTTE